jgi:hypothetical protein
MTVNELYQQAQSLSPEDRVELVNLLIISVGEELKGLLGIRPMTGEEIVASALRGRRVDKDLPDGDE